MIKLTGLWANKTKDGKTFLAGNLNQGTRIVVYPNKYKKSDKDPAYILYISQNERKEEQPRSREPDITEDDLPF